MRRVETLFLLGAIVVALFGGWNIQNNVLKHHRQIDLAPYYGAAWQAASDAPVEDLYVKRGGRIAFEDAWKNTKQTAETPPKSPTRYLYPPLFAESFQWLTWMDFETARHVWTWIQYVSVVVSVGLLAFSVPRSFRAGAFFLGMTVGVFSETMTHGLELGQVNGLLLLFLSFATFAFSRRRAVWDVVGSAATVFVVYMKAFQLFSLVDMLLRRWKIAVIGGIIAGVFFMLLSIGLSGLTAHIAYVSWIQPFITAPRTITDVTTSSCPSLACFVYRFTLTNKHTTPLVRMNGDTIDTVLSLVQYAALFLLIFAGFLRTSTIWKRFAVSRQPADRRSVEDLLLFHLFAVFPVLFSGTARAHYATYFLPLVVFSAALLWSRWKTHQHRNNLLILSGLLLVSVILTFFAFNPPAWSLQGIGIIGHSWLFWGFWGLYLMSTWLVFAPNHPIVYLDDSST